MVEGINQTKTPSDVYRMKTILKLFVTLAATSLTPVFLFFMCGFLGMIVSVPGLFTTFPSSLGGLPPIVGNLANMFGALLVWVFICVVFALPVSSACVLLLGIPAFLLGWALHAIRWWTTLGVSFLVGAIGSGIGMVILMLPGILMSPGKLLSMSPALLLSALMGIGFVVVLAAIGGFFGASGGSTFWILWRYWVQPLSPFGRPAICISGAQIGGFSEDRNHRRHQLYRQALKTDEF